jgi:hypothetical protein
MTSKKDDDKKPIGKMDLKRMNVDQLDADEERAQLRLLTHECFPGALHDKPIITSACFHSLILRHAHNIAIRGTDSQRRKAIIALSGIAFEKGE